MNIPIVSAAIGAGGGILGSIFGGIFGNKAQSDANATNLQIARETNQANRELAEYSYSQQLEQWHRQNQYNLPVNQMQRYADAGLNPNLIYGQGSNGNATSSPTYPTPTMRAATVAPVNSFANSVRGMFGELGQMVSTYNNLRIQESEINKNNEQSNLFKTQAKLLVAKEIGESIRNSYNQDYLPMLFSHQKQLFPYLRTTEYWRGAHLGQMYQNAITQGSIMEEDLIDKQRRNAEWDNIFKPLIEAQLHNWRKKNRALDDTHKLFDARKAFLEAQALNMQSTSGINYLDFLNYVAGGSHPNRSIFNSSNPVNAIYRGIGQLSFKDWLQKNKSKWRIGVGDDGYEVSVW